MHQYPHHYTNLIDNYKLQQSSLQFYEPIILYLYFFISFLFLNIPLLSDNQTQSIILKLLKIKNYLKKWKEIALKELMSDILIKIN